MNSLGMDVEVIPESFERMVSLCDAQSPVSLIASGRGSMKKPHPLDIRIPDCLCRFSGTVGPGVNKSGKGLNAGGVEGRPLRGRGRGTASGPPTRTYSSREKLIARTLDAKKMNEKDGKGFLMKKFLGQQLNPFLDDDPESNFSQSSGYSGRKSCPATLPASHTNKTEWPELSKDHGGPSSLHNQQKSQKIKGSKNGKTSKKKAGAITADGDCNLKESSLIEIDQISSKENKFTGKTAQSEMTQQQGVTEIAENVCSRSETVEMSNLNNNQSDKKEKDDADSGKSCKESEGKANSHKADLSTEAELSSLPEPSVGEVKSPNDSGEKLSLRDVAQQISSTTEETGNGVIGSLDETGGKVAEESAVCEEDVITETEEEELNYRLFVRHEEFQPGDLSPLTGPNVLQVEGLPSVINDEDVSDLFFSCGTVSACKVLRDAATKLCIGIAYVRLEESAACVMAVSSFDSEPSPFADIDGNEEVPLLKVQLLPASS